jgi:thiamine biosynthesis lipoprotein
MAVLAGSALRGGDDMMTMRVAREAMGTEFEILLCGRDEQSLVDAADEALDEVEELDRQMSLYNERSELCSINRRAGAGPVPVEPRLFGVLQLADRATTASEGAFDVTVAPLVKCWGFFRGQGKLPPEDSIAAALTSVGMRHVELRGEDRTVRFRRPGVQLDLGGIAKGYALDRAAEVLRERGITRGLIHGGKSSVYALGAPPDQPAWAVGIRHPKDPSRRIAVVDLRDRALSTSGNYEKFFEADGTVYSHIIDPRTGHPATGMLSASALGPTAAESDALSTAFFLMGEAKTREYCAAHPEMQAVLVPEPKPGESLRPVRVGMEPSPRAERSQ